MKRIVIETRNFSKEVESLISKRRLLAEDYEELKKSLVENPLVGDLIPGTGGVYKIRLKSISKGKSGGFRVCYYYYMINEKIFLVLIYQKNKQENITNDEKRTLKRLIEDIKGTK